MPSVQRLGMWTCALGALCCAATAQSEAPPPEEILAPSAGSPLPGEAAAEPAPSDLQPGGPAYELAPLPDVSELPELPYESIDLDQIRLDRLYEALARQPERRPVRMSLEECVALALRTNDDIEVLSYEPLMASGDILSAQGEFDPVLSGSATYLRASQSAAADIAAFGGVQSIENYRSDAQIAVSGRLYYGTQYQLSLATTKEETTFNQFFEEWSGTLSLTLTQPLLRGRGRDYNLANIRIAENSRRIAQNQLELTVMQTVSEVIRAYWGLVGALRTVEVREESLANAERLLRINRSQLEVGVAAKLDVVKASASVAARQGELVSARRAVEDAEDRLKQLLDLRDELDFAQYAIIPTDRPSAGEVEAREAESIRLALENRPDMRTAELQIESSRIEKERARKDMLPQLDITGTASTGGRDHKAREMFYGLRDQQDYSYSLGVEGSIPIPNRGARGQYRRARLGEEQAMQEYQQTELQLITNVRGALRAVETNKVLIEANEQSRRLQEANVIAEEKSLRLGASTSFEVLRVQEDLTNAQLAELQAMIDFEQALVDLRLAEGALLDELGIVVDAPELEEDTGFIESLIPREFDF